MNHHREPPPQTSHCEPPLWTTIANYHRKSPPRTSHYKSPSQTTTMNKPLWTTTMNLPLQTTTNHYRNQPPRTITAIHHYEPCTENHHHKTTTPDANEGDLERRMQMEWREWKRRLGQMVGQECEWDKHEHKRLEKHF